MSKAKAKARPKKQDRPLSAQQVEFIEEYLLDFNAKRAAIKVGYSAKTAEAQASRLLKNVKVHRVIVERQTKRAERIDISADRIEQELALMAFSDMKDFSSWGAEAELTDEQVRLLESAHMDVPPGRRARSLEFEAAKFLEAQGVPVVVRSVELIPSEKLGRESRAVQSITEGQHGVAIKLYDKQRALEMLARRHPEFTERKELTGKDGKPLEVKVNGGLSDETANAIREKVLGVKAKN